MDEFRFLGRALAGRGYAAARQVHRTTITAVEHEIKTLPPDIVQPDGSLDVYDDVQKLFKLVFEKGRPAIQCAGWLGYIPLNDHYVLEVNARVPIGNLERFIGLAKGYAPKVLKKYTRYFAHTTEQPATIFDALANQLLTSFDHAWHAGLLKVYERRQRLRGSPVGRIDPFETAWRTRKAGRPTGASSAFFRTPDTGPNRVLRHAFEKLLQRYLQAPDSTSHRSRLLDIRRFLYRLNGVGRLSPMEASPRAFAQYINRLPVHHEHYADALMLSQLIMADIGPSIRGPDHFAILPTILIDMSKVFEEYTRRLLTDRLSSLAEVEVNNGNKGGAGGAKEDLFEGLRPELKNRPVTPDIVVTVGGSPSLIIDAKYKLPLDVPDRPDVNQVVLYGAHYGCQRVMVLYAGRGENQNWVERVGNIGAHTLYTGHIDLAADQIEDEEQNFVGAVAKLLAA